MQSYDIITVGGGLGGSALAKVMAERGARVLVVERETHFKDRVRGEALAPWGVENVRRLGLFDCLVEHGNMLRYWRMFLGGAEVGKRDSICPGNPYHHVGGCGFRNSPVKEASLELVSFCATSPRYVITEPGNVP